MDFIVIIVTITGIIMSFSKLAQVRKIFKRKSAKDISFITEGVFFVGCFIWLIYAIYLNDVPLLVAESLSLVFGGLVIVGWYYYG